MTRAAAPTPTADSDAQQRASSWVPILLVPGYAVGVGLIVIAYHQAQQDTGFGHFAIFWLGFAAILAVTTVAGLRLPERGRALPGVLLLLGAVTFLPKLLMSPGGPIYYDEFAHLRHVQDVLATGDFGIHNDLLPVIQYYPGLSATTLGVHYLTGLGLWHAGQVVIAVAHCACPLLVYALARQVGLRQRAAFFAGLIYALNPGFMYFDSQYAYESLAIAFLLGTAVCVAAARRGSTPRRIRLCTVAGVVLALSNVLTHHISAFVMAVLCLLLAGFLPSAAESGASAVDAPDRAALRAQRIGPWVIAGVALVVAAVWNVAISPQTRTYLFSGVSTGFGQLFQLLSAAGSGTTEDGGVNSGAGSGAVDGSHAPFSGSSVPFYESTLAYAVPLLVLGIAIYTALRIFRSPARREEARRAAPFGILTVAYLGSLPLALTATGNQIAHRSWPFLFVGVAVFSVWTFGRGGLVRPRSGRRQRLRPGRAGVVLGVVLMMTAIGNVSAGANVAYRFPGPFVFGQDHRFESQELNDLVSWSARHLPPHARVVTDRFTGQPLLVGSTLQVATNNESFSNTLFVDPMNPSPQLRQFLRRHHFRYFILDRRILTDDPVQTFFQNYQGFTEKTLKALGSIRSNSFITLVHRTANYSVYRIDP